ncbi:hypothetical protein ABI59_19525 [Acidobacteria bacterium Mor1]|nr:hypothetical protein ABI59_19525 [Acidobacteria bacterium Mor1]
MAVALLSTPGFAAVIQADPSDYKSKIDDLQPGDTLQLAPGTYVRMTLRNVNGTAQNRIVIEGPADGSAIIEGESCCNTVQFYSCSFLTVRNLTVDSLGISGIDGFNAKGGISHDITLENNLVRGVGGGQQTVGISTKDAAWNWVIRGNTILEAGTGIYLGNSDGTDPFINGLIENNLIVDTIGYNMQIKHQNAYDLPQAPQGPNRTIIRNNTFIKDDRPSSNGNRPNLLVGPFPQSGQGSSDMYEVYGNFFYNNPRESLFQASGRVAIHDNVFVDAPGGTAIYLTDHNGPLDIAYVYNNTIYGGGRGIRFNNAAREDHEVVGNLIFSPTGISGNYSNSRDNLIDDVENAGLYVQNPSLVLGQMDFYPRNGQGQGTDLAYPASFRQHADYNLDFNGNSKGGFRFRGAYAGEGQNPGWQLDRGIKGSSGGSGEPPAPPTGLSAE